MSDPTNEAAVLSLPQATPYSVIPGPGERIIVLCPEVHLEPKNTDPVVHAFHSTMLRELMGLVRRMPIVNIVVEGSLPAMSTQLEPSRANPTSREELDARRSNGVLDDLQYLAHLAANPHTRLAEKEAIAPALCDGRLNMSDALQLIYCYDVNCVRGEDPAVADERQSLLELLADIQEDIGADRSVAEIRQRHGLALTGSSYPTAPFGEMLASLAVPPTSREELHAAELEGYREFRALVIQTYATFEFLTFERTHETVASRVDALHGHTLVIFGAHHAGDLSERLAKIGTVHFLDTMASLPPRPERRYSPPAEAFDWLPER